MQGSSPCFYQVDLLLRALVHDPKVEYVPPFIVLYSIQGDVKARFVFSRPEFFPPKSLIDDFPNTCNAPACKETNCSSVDWKKCVSLAKDSKLVRANIYPQGVACNFWPCNMREPRGDTVKTSFLKCAKCKDVLYCSSVCQVRSLKLVKFPVIELRCRERIGGNTSKYVRNLLDCNTLTLPHNLIFA